MFVGRVVSYTRRNAGAAALAALVAAALLWAGNSLAGTGSLSTDQGQNQSQDSRRFSGLARVVDGDTIVVAGLRVRLEGIDAPEASQTCTTRSGQEWACGTVATNALVRLAEGRVVSCDDRGLDKYGRTLGVCRAGGVEVNAEMVRLGLAWAFVRYSRAYVAVEAEARAARVGIWTGTAVPAWDYRAGRWQVAEADAPSGCAIKGNVSRNDRIYHMPWSPWYAKVRMDAGTGKRWFCSEAEALAAGWRPAQMH